MWQGCVFIVPTVFTSKRDQSYTLFFWGVHDFKTLLSCTTGAKEYNDKKGL